MLCIVQAREREEREMDVERVGRSVTRKASRFVKMRTARGLNPKPSRSNCSLFLAIRAHSASLTMYKHCASVWYPELLFMHGSK